MRGDASVFEINASTGDVTLIANPDYEAKTSYSFTVIASDASGNSAERSVSLKIDNQDDTSPIFTSSSTATAINENSGRRQVVYTANTADDSSVTYSLKENVGDASEFAINSKSGDVTLIANPDHEAKASFSFTVIATDSEQNSSELAVSLSIKDLDEIAPATPSAPELVAVSDMGSSDSDNVTSDQTPMLKGVVETGAEVEIFADGVSLDTVTANTNGEWSYEIPFEKKLHPGTVSITVQATDAAGNTSEQSSKLLLIVDDVPPEFKLSSNLYFLDENSGTGQLIYTADSTDDTKTVYSLQANSNDDANSFTIDADDGELRLDLDPDYEQQSLYTVNVVATDLAGNASKKTIYLRINDLDDKASAAPDSLDLTDLFDSGNSNHDNLTSITSPRFTGKAEPLSSIDVLVDGVTVGSASANSTGAWSFVIPASKGLLDGEHQISALAVDDSGNQSEISDSLLLTIDTTAPNFSSSNQFDVEENVGVDQVVATALASDPSVISYYLKQSLDDDAAQFSIHPISGEILLSHNPDYESKASYALTVVAEDSAGNSTDLKMQLNVIDLDDTPPAIPSAPDLLATSDTGLSDHDNLTSVATPTFTGTAQQDTYIELFADGISLGSTLASSDGHWAFEVPASSALSDGTHLITARSSYAAGYPSDPSDALSIVVDASAPSFISGSVANSIAEHTGANQRVYNAITPDDSDVTYALKLDNADDAALFTLNSLSGQVRLISDPDFDLQSSYSFTVVATDTAGNSSVQPVTLDIVDPDAPVFIPAYAWTSLFGTQSFEAGQAVHLDRDGSALVAGNTYVVDQESNQRSFDYFLVKYLADGTQSWFGRFGGEDNDLAYGISTGSLNEIYVTGVTASPELHGQFNSGYKDFFLSKYSSDGDHLWTRLGGSSGEEIGYATTTSPDGYIYVVGSTTSDGADQLNYGGKDIFVAKYSSGGDLIWHHLYGTDQDDVALDVVAGPNSDLFVAGFTDKDLNSERNLGESDGFVARLDSDGQVQWVRTIGSRGDDRATTLVTDNNGHVFVAATLALSLLETISRRMKLVLTFLSVHSHSKVTNLGFGRLDPRSTILLRRLSWLIMAICTLPRRRTASLVVS